MDGVVVGIVRKECKATLLLGESNMFDVHHGWCGIISPLEKLSLWTFRIFRSTTTTDSP